MAAEPEDDTAPLSRRLGLFVAGMAALVTLTAIFWSSSLPVWVGWRIYSEQVLIVALALSLAITFLTRPMRKRAAPGWFDQAAALVALGYGAYMVVRFPVLSQNVFYYPTEALIVSTIGFVLLVEGVRRAMGWALIVILAAVCLYALVSGSLSGPLQSRSIAPDRLLTFLMLDSASLTGVALYIAVSVVVPFLILAQLLLASGGSAFFSDLSLALTGRKRGGAGKIAIVGSAFFGSISGSAVSNVASTGAITIPLMKDGGYKPKTAAAIEAAASTGGQLMPPIMGAAAFLLAENLQVSYGAVMVAAIVPSLLYYVSLFIFADLEAGRLNIAPVSEDRIPAAAGVLRRGWFLLVPFVVLLGGLFVLNMRPETAALYAVGVLFLLSLVRTYDGRRINWADLLRVLVSSGRAAVEIILITAIAGMIIGLVARSGLSFGMGFFMVQLGQSSLFLLLCITALVCIVMGMGLPTVGVYLLLASLAAPPLIELGVDPMAAHMFVLYFGMLSMLTPPVAIAAFVAANMAKAPPMATGFEAVRIAWPAYLVPFLFVTTPALLLNAPMVESVITVVTALIGVYLITAGVVGYLARPLTVLPRLAVALAGAMVLLPHGMFDGAMWVNLAGIALGALLWRGEHRAAVAA